MPLEISEIGVRIAVGEPPVRRDDARRPDRGAELTPELVDAIVARCVTDVLRALRMAAER